MKDLKEFEMDSKNLVYVMTDNYHVMQGTNNGYFRKMNEACPNIIEVPGCLCHQANLMAKDEQKSTNSPVGSIIVFLTTLSALISTNQRR